MYSSVVKDAPSCTFMRTPHIMRINQCLFTPLLTYQRRVITRILPLKISFLPHSNRMAGLLVNEDGLPQNTALKAPYIKLYMEGTLNRHKISIMLELLKLDYHVRKLDFKKNKQKEDWFLELNPNGRIPTLSDIDATGNKLTLSESGAILLYLVDKHDKENKFSYAYGAPVLENGGGVDFPHGGSGPHAGTGWPSAIFTSEKIPYCIERYTNETTRLYGVLKSILETTNTGFLAGSQLTIADVTCCPWVVSSTLVFKSFLAWLSGLRVWERWENSRRITRQ